MIGNNDTYDMLLKLVKTRMSVRKFRPDPIPEDTINKILEVSRWAMSGANSQPWEFIVVTDPATKKQLRDAYSEYNTDFIFWMEQQREYNLRHPSYQVKNDPHESLKFNKAKANWHQAPAVIVVLGRRSPPVGHGTRGAYFRPRPIAPHRWLGQCFLLDSSRHRFFGPYFRVGLYTHSGAIQAHPRDPRSADGLSDHSHRPSRRSGPRRRAPAFGGFGSPRALRYEQVHEQRTSHPLSLLFARGDGARAFCVPRRHC